MKLIITIMFITILSACNKLWKDDTLSFIRTVYAGDELRIDGYYYLKYPVADGTNRMNIYFLYENGIILYGEAPSEANIETKEEDYRSGRYYDLVNDKKYYWGVFNIEGDNIQFERWYPSKPPLETYVRSGKIVNDSTFVITESYRLKGNRKKDINKEEELYRFKHFAPKPDSTNRFIK